MLPSQTRRIRPALLQEDREAQIALAAIASYQPANPAFSKENVAGALAAMHSAQEAETLAQVALRAARDSASAAEWRFHEVMLGAKDQVVAQYGVNSDEVQALGLKKKSEYKRPSRPVPQAS